MIRIASITLAGLLLAPPLAGQFLIPWSSVNSGGQPGAAPGFGLNGSSGQAVQGTGTATGYQGYWGFWYGWGTGGGPSPSESGWVRKADLPAGPKNKYVKDGGCLAAVQSAKCKVQSAKSPDDGSRTTDAGGSIYAFKGNNRYEFYQYNVETNTWAAKESIPAIGRAGKKKAVKKGAALDALGGKVFGMKGNGTLEFWLYVPGTGWTQLTDVPIGAKTVKEGSGLVAIWDDTDIVHFFLKGSATTEFYRYSTTANTWVTKANAPTGTSGKPFKNGSCLATDGTTIWALKGSYNEFYAYDIATDNWITKTPLPFIGSAGKKTKAKDGAGLAWLVQVQRTNDKGQIGEAVGGGDSRLQIANSKHQIDPDARPLTLDVGGVLYCLKGGNSREFWFYQADSDKWTQLDDMPLGGGKKVKGGGALCAGDGKLYGLKGNNTLEFYSYTPGATANDEVRSTNSLSSSGVRTSDFALRAWPNPFTDATTISYSLPRAGVCRLSLYDVTGKLVRQLADGYWRAGSYSINVHQRSSAVHIPSGIYVARLEAGSSTATTKLIIE